MFDELKTHQRGPRMVMRSKSPDLVKQKIWGHLCCHYAIRTLMVDAAPHARRDPDRVSFIAALRIICAPWPSTSFPPSHPDHATPRPSGVMPYSPSSDGCTPLADDDQTLASSNIRSRSGPPNAFTTRNGRNLSTHQKSPFKRLTERHCL